MYLFLLLIYAHRDQQTIYLDSYYCKGQVQVQKSTQLLLQIRTPIKLRIEICSFITMDSNIVHQEGHYCIFEDTYVMSFHPKEAAWTTYNNLLLKNRQNGSSPLIQMKEVTSMGISKRYTSISSSLKILKKSVAKRSF